MLSATYSLQATKTVIKHMRDPQFVFVSQDQPSLAGVKQYLQPVGSPKDEEECGKEGSSDPYSMFEAKIAWLIAILSQVPFHQCVVFSNQKGWSGDLVEALER